MPDSTLGNPHIKTEICVLGGGPAGATLARRLRQLGHEVVVVEQAVFPRAHVGESLVGGVLPLLDVLELRREVENAAFLRPDAALVRWSGQTELRRTPGAPGFQVDRGRFDQVLLQAAAEAGARILQPARAVRAQRSGYGNWLTQVRSGNRQTTVESHILADATGRAGLLPGVKRRLSQKTLALYAYWRDVPLTGAQTRVEAGEKVWYWGAPLPGGEFNATVFLDPGHYRKRAGKPGGDVLYESLLARSELLKECLRGCRSEVHVCDATTFADDDSVTEGTIKVGEAAFAIDPLSSQGVQTAIGNGLHAATVLHTMLQRPDDTALAMDFYRRRQRESVELHARAAGRFYAEAAQSRAEDFWQLRAINNSESQPEPLPLMPDTEVRLASGTHIETIPTSQGDFIVPALALTTPALPHGITFLGNVAIVPLTVMAQEPIRADFLLQAWAQRIPHHSAVETLRWLWRTGVLVDAKSESPS